MKCETVWLSSFQLSDLDKALPTAPLPAIVQEEEPEIREQVDTIDEPIVIPPLQVPIVDKPSARSPITNRPNSARSEASSQHLEDRFKNLQKCVLDIEPDYAEIQMSGSALDVDALLDLLVGMYDECKQSVVTPSPTTDNNEDKVSERRIQKEGYFSAFLDRC